MRLDVAQVQKVAKLGNLKLSSDEEDKFASQLSAILGYVEELNAVDTANIEPTFNIVNAKNITREDIEEIGLSQEEALHNAPQKKDGFFVSKGVFKNE